VVAQALPTSHTCPLVGLRVRVGGEVDGSFSFYNMTTQTNSNPPSIDRKKHRADDSLIVSDDDCNASSYPTFLVLEPTNGQRIELSIFGIQKLLKCAVGDVKNAKKTQEWFSTD
jgi:hypothetical protein